MSDTPRTDQVVKNCNGWHHVPVEFSRELERENAALRAKLEPQRQKIWVLVMRLETGTLVAQVFTEPNHPMMEHCKSHYGPNNYVEIHASI